MWTDMKHNTKQIFTTILLTTLMLINTSSNGYLNTDYVIKYKSNTTGDPYVTGTGDSSGAHYLVGFVLFNY